MILWSTIQPANLLQVTNPFQVTNLEYSVPTYNVFITLGGPAVLNSFLSRPLVVYSCIPD